MTLLSMLVTLTITLRISNMDFAFARGIYLLQTHLVFLTNQVICIYFDFNKHASFIEKRRLIFARVFLEKKTTFVAPAKQSTTKESLCPSSVCRSHFAFVCSISILQIPSFNYFPLFNCRCSFYISGFSNVSSFFNLDSATGSITTLSSLDREMYPSFLLCIQASQAASVGRRKRQTEEEYRNALASRANDAGSDQILYLMVKVTDVNDQGPMFTDKNVFLYTCKHDENSLLYDPRIEFRCIFWSVFLFKSFSMAKIHIITMYMYP